MRIQSHSSPNTGVAAFMWPALLLCMTVIRGCTNRQAHGRHTVWKGWGGGGGTGYLLQAEDVRGVLQQLLQQVLLPILPAQHPRRAVRELIRLHPVPAPASVRHEIAVTAGKTFVPAVHWIQLTHMSGDVMTEFWVDMVQAQLTSCTGKTRPIQWLESNCARKDHPPWHTNPQASCTSAV